MKQLISWVGMSVTCLVAGVAYAGAGSSGGGDNFAEDAGAAWFLGSKRTISACIETAADFGVSKDAAKQAIEQAFHTWRDYTRKKLLLPQEDLGIAMQVNISERCSGNDDLVFYLGVMTDEVRAAWAKHTNPTAFTYRRSYDRKAEWGQGWIWVASQGSVIPAERFPMWSSNPPPALQNGALDTILVHEIGHVFGVPHVEGTVMTERISEQLRVPTFAGPQIDQERELILCSGCSFDRHGGLGLDAFGVVPGGELEDAIKKQERERFKFLMGREAKGDIITARIRLDQMQQHCCPVRSIA